MRRRGHRCPRRIGRHACVLWRFVVGPHSECISAFTAFASCPFELTPNPRYLVHHGAASRSAQQPAVRAVRGQGADGARSARRARARRRCCARRSSPSDVATSGACYISNPALTRQEFVGTLAARFELGRRRSRVEGGVAGRARAGAARAARRGRDHRPRRRRGPEPQPELLEEIRLLANIETATEKLLPLVLAGQPELAARLEGSSRSASSSSAWRCGARSDAVRPHRDSRLHRQPDQDGRRSAVPSVHARSGDADSRALTRNPANDQRDLRQRAGERHGAGRQPVDRGIVLEVCRDFHLQQENGPAAEDSSDGDSEQAPSELEPLDLPIYSQTRVRDRPAAHQRPGRAVFRSFDAPQSVGRPFRGARTP